ncbi:MAG: family 78 glycoside hydrolase catalytic domain [Eubacteriales bacterium]|nr:family 78 glycoside hydrolase catalytic domain [Eubacteriales bacterium]
MIRDLQICYQKNPIGLDELPRFSWKLSSEKQNVMQQAYQIQVIGSGQMVWDTGIVESEQSVLVPYAGEALLPMTVYQVQVSVWDNYKEMGQCLGSFETGLMTEENFAGMWITHAMPEEENGCPVYSKVFTNNKKIRNARIYATALGVYEICVNGEKVSDVFFAPGWTSYHNRLQYQTYDVTEILQEAQSNEICILSANGWYKGELGFDARPNRYGNKTAVRAVLVIEYEDGTTETIGTDESWDVTVRELRYSEIYHGEQYDFSAEKRAYGKAVPLAEAVKIGRIIAQESEPVRITKRFAVKEKIITPKGELVFDFGQNMAGFVEVVLPQLTGEKLVIRHAETLDKDGNFYTENLRTARCTDSYIYGADMVGCKVHPRFTFHGFRYICVEGAADADAAAFEACALHTDMKQSGTFTVDHPLINQLQSNIEWGQRSNFLDVPTDCPQRDERLGWTGDAQVFSGTASYNFQTANFFKKWLRDMAVETNAEWGVPHVVPNILGDQAGAAAWSDAATIIPWNLYRIYGDVQLLEEEYPLMKAWVEYMRAHAGENGLWQNGFQYGDWLALDIESGSTDRTGGTDKYLVANAYYAYSTNLLRKAAEELGYAEDAAAYASLYESILAAYNEEFVTKTGRLVSETQTACVLMLYFDLVKPEHRPRILETLEKNIGAHHGHLTTGFVGTPYLCHCLSEEGLHSVANEIVLKEDFPSWLYAVKKGATTIWERWNSIQPDGSFDESGMNSLNHYAYGSIGSWFYEKVAGITPLAPGYKKISVAPKLTKGIMEYKAGYESVYGLIRSEMSCKDGKLSFTIEIPANTTAIITLPEKEESMEVGSGVYQFAYETNVNLKQERFTMESTLGELVAEELGRQMFEQLVPGMLDNPLIKFAYGMTISELLVQSMDAKPLYMAVIDALNNQ